MPIRTSRGKCGWHRGQMHLSGLRSTAPEDAIGGLAGRGVAHSDGFAAGSGVQACRGGGRNTRAPSHVSHQFRTPSMMRLEAPIRSVQAAASGADMPRVQPAGLHDSGAVAVILILLSAWERRAKRLAERLLRVLLNRPGESRSPPTPCPTGQREAPAERPSTSKHTPYRGPCGIWGDRPASGVPSQRSEDGACPRRWRGGPACSVRLGGGRVRRPLGRAVPPAGHCRRRLGAFRRRVPGLAIVSPRMVICLESADGFSLLLYDTTLGADPVR
jgi:hypothetical protein